MKTRLSILIIVLFSLNCKKDTNNNTNQKPYDPLRSALTTDVAGDVETGDCIRNWWGKYVNEFGVSDTISQHAVIAGGVARCPTQTYPNYHTGIYYHLPLCQDVNGDNIRLEASVKNPSGISGSIYAYDVALQLEGRLNTAEVYFVGSSSAISYSHMWVGNSSVYGLSALYHYFNDFETVSMEIKHGIQTITLNGSDVASHSYGSSDHMGQIKRIGVGFKGSGTIDWVKLYNATTGELLMKEDFDVDGHSNAIWY